MPVRPKSNSNSFTGFKAVGIKEIIGKSHPKFDFLIEFVLDVEGSSYPVNMSLLGTFNKTANGDIDSEDSSVKRIYRVLDGLGEGGGVDIKGNWVDENNNPISDFAEYLSKKYITPEGQYPYKVYLYKGVPKTAGDKVYTRVYPKLVPNTKEGDEDLRGFIDFMISNAYLIVYDESQPKQPTAFNNQF